VQFYSSAGQILYSTIVGGSGAGSTGGSSTRYVYLGQRLIAETKTAGSASTTRYIHTDGLGSPVAHTDASGTVVDRSRYEAYGANVNIAGSTNPVGIGFTGHVNDVDTGLVYMQQRYYDPVAGRFLSTDQVLTDTSSGASFNRYDYASNNPYRYTDPDGRDIAELLEGSPLAAAGNAFGALAAYAQGLAARDTILETVAVQGMADSRSANIEAVVFIGSMGRSGGGSKYVPGGRMSPKTKEITAKNADNKCEYCGTATVKAKQSEAGVIPPKNEGVTDHIKPKSKDGDNSPGNAAHACRECNGKKSDKPVPHPRLPEKPPVEPPKQ
jgi:RHS repeat-associated protein